MTFSYLDSFGGCLNSAVSKDVVPYAFGTAATVGVTETVLLMEDFSVKNQDSCEFDRLKTPLLNHYQGTINLDQAPSMQLKT